MPMLTVDGTTIEVAEGTRLVLAIQAAGVQIGHRCGGHARCTTCRVEFAEGEPTTMTKAEYQKLNERGLFGQARLACQIECHHDMAMHALMTLSSEGWSDTGPQVDSEVKPEALFHPIEELKS
ncbi:MAG: (2Fe-2S)-binding protein [Chloroflexaceae bacterium]|nr:(2Fe-2S)-binding protein [Chloroflexaceae bacterium]